MAAISLPPASAPGLDVASIVSQLVAAERGPADQRISIATTRANTSISALAQFSFAAMANLQTARRTRYCRAAMAAASSLGKLTATPAKLDVLTPPVPRTRRWPATTRWKSCRWHRCQRSAPAISYASEQRHRRRWRCHDRRRRQIIHRQSHQIRANTLADLRDKINAASDNSGVGAAIVSDGGGARLLLTSRSHRCTANAVSVSTYDLQHHGVPACQPMPWSRSMASQTTSSSNAVTTAVDGLTLNLVKAEPGTSTTLTVGLDSESLGSRRWRPSSTPTTTSSSSLPRRPSSIRSRRPPASCSAIPRCCRPPRQLRNVIGGSSRFCRRLQDPVGDRHHHVQPTAH